MAELRPPNDPTRQTVTPMQLGQFFYAFLSTLIVFIAPVVAVSSGTVGMDQFNDFANWIVESANGIGAGHIARGAINLLVVTSIYALHAVLALWLAVRKVGLEWREPVRIILLGLATTLATSLFVLQFEQQVWLISAVQQIVFSAVLGMLWLRQIVNARVAFLQGVAKRLSFGGLPALLGLWLAAFVASVAVQLVIATVYMAFTGLPYAPQKGIGFVENFSLASPQFWVLAVGAVVFAPLWEELFFRRFMLSFILTRLGDKTGMLIAALVFGVAHVMLGVSWFLLPTFVFLGVALGYAYLRSGYWGAVLLHSCHNLVVLVVAVAFGDVLNNVQ